VNLFNWHASPKFQTFQICKFLNVIRNCNWLNKQIWKTFAIWMWIFFWKFCMMIQNYTKSYVIIEISNQQLKNYSLKQKKVYYRRKVICPPKFLSTLPKSGISDFGCPPWPNGGFGSLLSLSTSFVHLCGMGLSTLAVWGCTNEVNGLNSPPWWRIQSAC